MNLPSSPTHIAYLAHTFRSDWNNGNAHFLRGLLRALGNLGHRVTGWEPAGEWSLQNLQAEARGADSVRQFDATYADLDIRSYKNELQDELRAWRERLRGVNLVILHEWNPPALAQILLSLRAELGFKLVFHDTHHRASSTPESFAGFGLDRFDGVLAFGEALREIYRTRFGLHRVWTLHEAADVTVFRPQPGVAKELEGVWIGNWGEGERSAEIGAYLLRPAAVLAADQDLHARFRIYGVRYPDEGLAALAKAGVAYGGYLPNLQAPAVYAAAKLTVHIPRQQYSQAMHGIPTIRVFEALACGIPLVSAPWQDTEQLFRPGDFLFAHSTAEMTEAMRHLLTDTAAAAAQAARGLETVLARHTCDHRARELTAIAEELFA